MMTTTRQTLEGMPIRCDFCNKETLIKEGLSCGEFLKCRLTDQIDRLTRHCQDVMKNQLDMVVAEKPTGFPIECPYCARNGLKEDVVGSCTLDKCFVENWGANWNTGWNTVETKERKVPRYDIDTHSPPEADNAIMEDPHVPSLDEAAGDSILDLKQTMQDTYKKMLENQEPPDSPEMAKAHEEAWQGALEEEMEPVEDSRWSYHEDLYLMEIENYLANTYQKHYIGEMGGQVFDEVNEQPRERAIGFLSLNANKYLKRYGRKNGYNRKDILKAIHYCFALLYNHDMHEHKNDKMR